MTPENESRLGRLLKSVVELRKGEASSVLRLAIALGLVLGSLSVLKPARNALFLDQLGVRRLPYVLMLVAIFGGLAAALFGRFSTRIRVDRLIVRTFLVLLATLAGFRLLLPGGELWVFYAFYVWVSLYGLFAVSLVWLYAGEVYDSRQARRVFGFIGTGGIAGAVLGGVLTSLVAGVLGTENLLILSAGLIVLALLSLRGVRIGARQPPRKKAAPRSTFSTIRSSRLLVLIAITVAITAVVSVIVDVQFNEAVEQAFEERDEKAAFFGQFFAAISAVAFLVQLLATPKILRARGAVFGLGLLPLSLGLGSLAVFFFPGLISAVAVKTGDGGLRYSLHKAATEMLFLPLSAEVKSRAKLFLDAAVDAIGSGFGAAMVWVLTRKAGVEHRELSWVSIGLVVPWLYLTAKMRGAYLDAFRKALERREIDLSQLREQPFEEQALKQIAAILETKDERQLAYALELLAPARDRALVPALLPLLAHPSAEIRASALRPLQRVGGPANLEAIEPLADDPAPEVRQAAISFLLTHAPDRRERLRQYLEPSHPAWLGAIIWIGEHGSREERSLIDAGTIEALLGALQASEGSAERAHVARALGAIGEPSLLEPLKKLAEHGTPEVAAQALEAISRIGDASLLPWLISLLDDPRRRKAARHAISAFGSDATRALAAALGDRSTPELVRRHIPRVLAELPGQLAVDVLVAALEDADPSPRLGLLKALNRLRADRPDLRFDRNKLKRAFRAEAGNYALLTRARALIQPGWEGSELLLEALSERQRDALERSFRLLALRYPAGDMLSAFDGLVSGRPNLKASALELLDQVLRGESRALFLPLLEQDTGKNFPPMADEPLSSADEALRKLAAGDDGWLRACAIFAAARPEVGQLPALLSRALEDPDPRVRDVARELQRRRSGAPPC